MTSVISLLSFASQTMKLSLSYLMSLIWGSPWCHQYSSRFSTAVKTKIPPWTIGLTFFCDFCPRQEKLVQISRLLIEKIFSRMT